MKRKSAFGLMLTAVLASALLFAWSASHADDGTPAAPQSPAVQAILNKMDSELNRARQNAITELRKLQKVATKKGNLKEALAFDQPINDLEKDIKRPEPAPPSSIFQGAWRETHASGFKADRMVRGDTIYDDKGVPTHRWKLRSVIEIRDVVGSGAQDINIDPNRPDALRGAGSTGVPVEWQRIKPEIPGRQ